MKKILLLGILLISPILLHSQVCVTLYQGDDFGLEDLYDGYEFIDVDRMGNKWFGMDIGAGIIINGHSPVGRFDGASWVEVPYLNLPHWNVNDISFDLADSAWIATDGGLGIYHIESLEGQVLTTSNSDLPENKVTAIDVGPGNTVWMGFSSGKVASFNGAGFKVHTEWSNSPVKDIKVSSGQGVWVALGGSPGLVRYHNEVWTQYPGLKDITAVESDQWGRVMVASGDSMIIYLNDNVNVVRSGDGNSIRDIAVRSNGAIWASSSRGLLVRSGDRFVPFSSLNSGLPSSLTNPVVFDPSDNLWFGYKYIIDPKGYIGTGYLSRNTDLERAEITADKESLVFCYGDSLTLQANADMTGYVWPDGSNLSTYRVYDAQTVEVAVEGDNQCFFYDTVKVNVQKVYEEEKVCAVSVDSNGRNIIIWERTQDVGSKFYRIYRMSDTNIFRFVAEVPFEKLSVFEDPDIDPTARSASYRISVVDSCGNESEESFYHRTIHLQILESPIPGEVPLRWTRYEGLNFSQYILYRGPHPDSMEVLTTFDTASVSFTDKGVFDTVYYRIGIPLPNECAPDGNQKAGTGPYRHSLSNMDDNKKLLDGIFFRKSLATELIAYPNPFSEISRVEFPNPRHAEYSLLIYDISGQKLRETRGIHSGETYIERGDLAPGYYLFELRGDRRYFGKFVIR